MITEYLSDVAFFALLFFSLVFFHELGHFLMARFCGVRVEKFSIGMGPAIFSKKLGDTEYRLAILPLGGYVKMSGDDPSKNYDANEAKIGFLSQHPFKKLLIVFGGPVFNLILPIFIFAIMLIVGVPKVESLVGILEDGKPAATAGLEAGDKVLAVNGQKISEWQQLEDRIRKSPNQVLGLDVERIDIATGQIKQLNIQVTPDLSPGKTRFGEDTQVGRIGVGPFFKMPIIFFEGSMAAWKEAGVQSLDRVIKVNDVNIITLEQLNKALETHGKEGVLRLQLHRGEAGEIYQAEVKVPEGAGSVLERLGVQPVELVVGAVQKEVQVKEGSREIVAGPAFLAGLQAGDRLVSIDGKKLSTWDDVPTSIKAAAGRPFEVAWSRDGKMMSETLLAKSTVLSDPMMGKDNPLTVTETPRIGVEPVLKADARFVIEQSYNPIVWVKRGAAETWDLITLTGEALGKLVTGQLSLRTLGSPIMIFKVAGNSYRVAGGGQQGWSAFLKTLMLLSVSLGLVNLFPIPVLDGGHAVLFTLEWIRGRPVSLKVMERLSQVGIVALMGLFVLVIYNDFVRYHYIDKIVEFFQ